MMTTEEMIKYDQLIELDIATAEEINLARKLVSGSWNEVLDAIVYARTGYKTFEQYYFESEEEEE